MSEKSYKPVSIVLQGTNDTFKGYINMTVKDAETTPVDYDEVGAAYYVIAVVLVYGLSMVLLIGSLAKKNMKDSSLEHDDRQVSRYLENVPSLKEMSAREQYKELKSNIITLVTSKTPPGDLFRSHSTSSLDRDDPLASSISDCKKVSFSIGDDTVHSKAKKPDRYGINKDLLGVSDTSASENSPLLGYGSPESSPFLGYHISRTRGDSDGYTQDSDSELDIPVLKPKFKYRSSWGETRVYNKVHYSAVKHKNPSHMTKGKDSTAQTKKPHYRVTAQYDTSHNSELVSNQVFAGVSDNMPETGDSPQQGYPSTTIISPGEHIVEYNEAFPVKYIPDSHTKQLGNTAFCPISRTSPTKGTANVLQPLNSTIRYSSRLGHTAVKQKSAQDCNFEVISEMPPKTSKAPQVSNQMQPTQSIVYIPEENRLRAGTSSQEYRISPRGSPLMNIKDIQTTSAASPESFYTPSHKGAFTPFQRDPAMHRKSENNLDNFKRPGKYVQERGNLKAQGQTTLPMAALSHTNKHPYQKNFHSDKPVSYTSRPVIEDSFKHPRSSSDQTKYHDSKRSSSNFGPQKSDIITVDIHRTIADETFKDRNGISEASNVKGRKIYCKVCHANHLPPKCSIVFHEGDPICHSSDGESSDVEDEKIHVTTV